MPFSSHYWPDKYCGQPHQIFLGPWLLTKCGTLHSVPNTLYIKTDHYTLHPTDCTKPTFLQVARPGKFLQQDQQEISAEGSRAGHHYCPGNVSVGE